LTIYGHYRVEDCLFIPCIVFWWNKVEMGQRIPDNGYAGIVFIRNDRADEVVFPSFILYCWENTTDGGSGR